MLLRTLWSRSGAQRLNPVFISASVNLSQSVQPRWYESKPRTHSNSSRSCCCLNTLHQQRRRVQSLSSSLLTDPGVLDTCRSGQKRLYSSDLVKSMLKPGLKPAAVPGKRVPKGPRTKQPSRANQPPLNEDKVDE